jgi:hypothetical protein
VADTVATTRVDGLVGSGGQPVQGVAFMTVLTHAHLRKATGEVCKTFMRRFDSDPRLQLFL